MINFFDILVVVLVVLHGIAGFREGLLRGVVKLAGFAAVAAGLFLFAGPISDAAENLPMPSSVAIPLAFVVLLILGMVVCSLAAEMVGKMVHLTPLGFVDSGFGVAFGMLKALLVAGMLAFLLSCTPKDGFLHSQCASSRTAPGRARCVNAAVPFAARTGKALAERFAPLAAPDAPSPGKDSADSPVPSAPDSSSRNRGLQQDGTRGEKR